MSARGVIIAATDRRRPQAERSLGDRAVESDQMERLGATDAGPGERIRIIRRARGLTQEQLARATGVSRSAVAQWETGRAGFGGKLAAIASALDVSARQLKASAGEMISRERASVRISNQEATLLRHFRELGNAEQACMLLLARRLAAVGEV